ncbi:MAG: YoaK family protein [Terracidiphilus sp.]
MRASERDLLLLMLAVSAGSADGWSYFGIGHAFVANMTGNTVLLGVDIFGHGGDLLHPAIAIGCYAAGVVLAALLTRNVCEGDSWPRPVSATLLVESILLAGSEVAWTMFLRHPGPGYGLLAHERNWLLGGVAFAVGMQSGAMVQLRIPGVVTTYITGTWTSLMSGLTRLASGKLPARARSKHAFEERLLLQGSILAVYFLSAMLTGWVLESLPAAVGVIPAASVCVVAVFGLASSGGSSASTLS